MKGSACTSYARTVGGARRGMLPGKLFEVIAIDDLHISSVSGLQDPVRGKHSERPAYRRRRGTYVFGDIRAIHRNIYFVCRSIIGGLKLVKQS